MSSKSCRFADLLSCDPQIEFMRLSDSRLLPSFKPLSRDDWDTLSRLANQHVDPEVVLAVTGHNLEGAMHAEHIALLELSQLTRLTEGLAGAVDVRPPAEAALLRQQNPSAQIVTLQAVERVALTTIVVHRIAAAAGCASGACDPGGLALPTARITGQLAARFCPPEEEWLLRKAIQQLATSDNPSRDLFVEECLRGVSEVAEDTPSS